MVLTLLKKETCEEKQRTIKMMKDKEKKKRRKEGAGIPPVTAPAG